MENNFSIKKIDKEDTLISMYFGRSTKIRLLGDGNYIVAAYFPTADVEVMYTEDGIPNWGCAGDKEQTVFLERDLKNLKFTDFDFSALGTKDMVDEYDLKNYKNNDTLTKLQIRTHIGMWRDISSAPMSYIENAIANKEFHLFRKKT